MLYIEDVSSPIIGETYGVPCVASRSHRTGKYFYIPRFGTNHIDSPELGEDGTQPHFHVDYRFVTNEERENFGWEESDRGGIALKISREIFLTQKVRVPYIREDRKMLRDWYPTMIFDPIPARRKFEESYKNTKLDCNKCPHQGTDLTQVGAVNGIRICPSHLLAWDENGDYVSPDDLRQKIS